jgi:hypothetical protein
MSLLFHLWSGTSRTCATVPPRNCCSSRSYLSRVLKMKSVRNLPRLLVEQMEEWLNTNPVNMRISEPRQPQLRILENGELEYTEVLREGVTDSINYVDEVACGLEYNDALKRARLLDPTSQRVQPVPLASS